MSARRTPALSALSCLLALACAGERAAPREEPRRLIILGIDGMDHALLSQYLREGRTPHLAALAKQGGFLPLETSNPPQSPVAWSHVITGQSSSGHGIYDFVHRDPAALSPYLSTSRAREPESTLSLLGWQLPLGAGTVELLREGASFWELLEAQGLPATVLKIPANFPPDEAWSSQTLSGMGTPDLMGTYGTFQLFTSDPALASQPLSGGIVRPLRLEGQRAEGTLLGPPNPFLRSQEPLSAPLELFVDAARPVALVRLSGQELLLSPGEWSGWLPVSFDPGALAPESGGAVRLFLKSVRPQLNLYVSPVNIDPAAPLMPISSPRPYAEELAARLGRFYTQGMPQDTKALAAGVLSDEEFLAQARLILEEERRMLDDALRHYRGGLLFYYFSTIDQVSHVFFRALDPEAPPEVRQYASVIPELYTQLDAIVGEVMARAGEGATILVISDHGFAPYRWKAQLNRWLLEQGYLTLSEAPEAGPLGHLDWPKTQAYALGLNQLFLNLEDRERHGVVTEEERELLLERLSRELLAWRNPETGERVVSRVFRPEPGAFPDRAPDLLIGYARGYRSSDESAVGGVTDRVLERNHDEWSGDHCIDPAEVPGVLLSNRPFARPSAALIDISPTILEYFGLRPSEEIEGRGLFSKE